jgi:hypothetical protein
MQQPHVAILSLAENELADNIFPTGTKLVSHNLEMIIQSIAAAQIIRHQLLQFFKLVWQTIR